MRQGNKLSQRYQRDPAEDEQGYPDPCKVIAANKQDRQGNENSAREAKVGKAIDISARTAAGEGHKDQKRDQYPSGLTG